ncbi:hypothetical protein OIV83_002255 [Microbotryomycetes sp. JL201]|nr:hypothetical protein OIV83_002255 [Microbotryomycetes sp. JL201]
MSRPDSNHPSLGKDQVEPPTFTYALGLTSHVDTPYTKPAFVSSLVKVGLRPSQSVMLVPLFSSIPATVTIDGLKTTVEQDLKQWRQEEVERRAKMVPRSSEAAYQEGVKVTLESTSKVDQSDRALENVDRGKVDVVSKLEIPRKLRFDVAGTGVTGDGTVFVDLEDDPTFDGLWVCLRERVTELVLAAMVGSTSITSTNDDAEQGQSRDEPVEEGHKSHKWHSQDVQDLAPPEEFPRLELGSVAGFEETQGVLRVLSKFKQAQDDTPVFCDAVALVKIDPAGEFGDKGTSELLDKVALA